MPKRRHHKGRASVESVERRILLAGNLDPTFASAGISISDYPNDATAAAVVPTVNKFFVLLGNSTVGKTVLEQMIVASFFRPDGKLDTGSDAGAAPERVTVDIEPSANETVIASAALANGDVVIAGTIESQALVAVLRPTGVGDPDKPRSFLIVANRFIALANATTTAATDVIVDAAGRIVVVGVASIQGGAGRQVFAVRYTGGGLTLDNNFGSGGSTIFYSASGGIVETARVAEVGTTGSTTVAFTDYPNTKSASSSVRGRRLDDKGIVDGVFNLNFAVSGTVVQPTRLGDILADGTGLTIAGEFGSITSTPAGFAARVTNTGSVVSQATSLGSLNSVTSLTRQADGKIIAAGFDSLGSGEPSFVSVSRLQSSLAIDNSYGGTNTGNIVVSSLSGKAQGVMIDTSTGRAVLAADDAVTGQDLALVGLTPDLPDFFASSFGVQGTLTLGQLFNTSVTVFSNRALPTPATTVRYTLTRASTGFSLVVGEAPVPALAGNSNTNVSASFTLPGGIPAGTGYTLTAFVDPDNEVNEENENANDNGTSASVTIAGSDLQASTFGVGGTITLGTSFQPSSLLIFNNPTATTTAFNIRYDLMRSGTLVSTLATVNTPILGASASRSIQPTLTIPAGTPGGTYQLRATLDSDNVVPEVNETNNTSTTANFTVVGPNLIVSTFTPPASAAPGAQFSSAVTITNNGSAAAAATTVRLQLTGPSTIVLGTFAVPSIPNGSSASINPSVIIPSNAPFGSYSLTATVDPAFTIAELNESDNNAPRAFAVEAADLSATSLSQPVLTLGVPASVSVGISNGGNIASGSFKLRLALSGSGGNVALGDFDVASIAAGGSATATPTVIVPAGTAVGSYTLTATVDATSLVIESNETNNTLSRGITVQGFNLAPSALTTPSAVRPGDIAPITFTVANNGNIASPASTAQLRLSSQGAPDISRTIAIPAIAAGGASPMSTSLSIPSNAPLGGYSLTVILDPTEAAAESNEADNEALVEGITIGLPNLTLGNPQAPASSFLNAPVDVIFNATNNGTIAAAATSVRVELIGAEPNTTGNIYLLGDIDIAGLGAGETQSISKTLVLEQLNADHNILTRDLGSYSLLFTIDPDDTQLETNSTDNTAARPFTILGVDLTSNSITAASTIRPGQTLAAAFDIKNDGNVASPQVLARLQIEPSAGGAAIVLGDFNVPAISAGSSAVLNVSPVIPANTPLGSYTLRVIADPTNIVGEVQEDNNGIAIATLLIQAVDLTPTVLTAAASVFPGNGLPISHTVSNLGNLAAGATVVRFSLVGATTIQLGDFPLAAIAAGSTGSLSPTLTVPANAPLGSYSLTAVVDPSNTVAESNEANNTISRTVIVQAADLAAGILTTSSTTTPGASLSVSFGVSNIGNLASAATTVRYELVNIATSAVTALGDVALGGLAAAANTTLSPSFTVPASTPLGNYNLRATIDPSSQVAENNEANNQSIAAIFVQGINLTPTALTAAATIFPGNNLPTSITIANTGNLSSPATTVRLTLVGGSTIDLGSFALAGIAGGASATITPTVTIPAGTALAAYTLTATVDPAAAIAEINETDNAISRTLTVQAAGLSVVTFSTAAFGMVGSSITFSTTIQNPGNLASNAGQYSLSLFGPGGTFALGSFALPVIAAGANSGALGGSFTVPQTTPGAYTITLTADSTNTTPEVNESNNTATAAFSVQQADLQPTAITAAPSVFPGNSLAVSVTVTNNGNTSAGATVVRLSLVGATTIQLGDFAVASLAAGASTTLNLSPLIPNNTPLASYTLTAVVDPADNVAEANELNNTISRALTVLAPNLTAQSFTAPTTVSPGGSITANITVANTGNQAAAATTLRFLVKDGSTTAADLGSFAVPALAGGATFPFTGQLAIPANLPPKLYTLLAVVDLDSLVTEADENDNSLSRSLTVQAADLSVSAFNTSAAGLVGATVNFTATFQNLGNIPSVAGQYSLSFSGPGGTFPLGSFTLPAIAASSSSGELSGSFTVPQTAIGAYTVTLTADSTATTPEFNESNNTATATFTVQQADLQPTSITAAAAISPGTTLPVSITYINNGNATATPSTLRLSLVGATTIPLGEITLASLGAGFNTGLLLSPFIPANTPPGNYALTVTVDADNTLPESNEANNTLSRALTVQSADLAVSNFTLPPAGSVGGDVPFSATISNLGNLPSSAGTYTLILTGEFTNLLLGSFALPAITTSLAVSGSFTVPNRSVGNYTITLLADSDNTTTETNELNNTAAQAFTIQAPNLTITSLLAPNTAAPGQTIGVSITIQNNGNAASPATTGLFQLFVDPGEPVSPSAFAIPAIPAGGSVTLTPDFTVQPALAPVNYTLRAIADSTGTVSETNELDNIATRAIAIQQPNLTLSSFITPPVVSVGETYPVSVTVTNTGNGPAASSQLRITLSRVGGFPIELALDTLPALAPGAEATFNFNFLTFAGVGVGEFQLTATADSNSIIFESNKSDNVAVRPLFVQTLDLSIPTVNVAPTVFPGEELAFSFDLRNAGNVAVAPVIKIELVTPSETFLLSIFEPAQLSAGTTQQFDLSFPLPSGVVEGTEYELRLTVDPEELLAESNETNNTTSAFITPGAADIAVANFTANSVRPLSPQVYRFDLVNLGTAPTGTIHFNLRLTGPGIDVVVANETVQGLSPGASESYAFIFDVPDLTPGSYQLTLVADPEDTVRESNETNNQATAQFQVIGPNLAFGPLAPPAKVNPGTAFELFIPVQNIGTDLSPATIVRVELKGATTLYAEDLPLSGLAPSQGLFNLIANIAIPASTALGDYQLTLTINPDNTIPNESAVDNTFTSTIEVVPVDLAVVSSAPTVTQPPNPFVKQVSFSATVTNNSVLPSPATTARVKLTRLLADLTLDTIAIPSLAPGATMTITGNYTVSKSVIGLGTATFAITLDPDSQIVESNEANNSFTAPVLIASAQLDFVGGLTAPSTAVFPSDAFPVSFTIANSGNQASAATVVQFFINDFEFTQVQVPPILPGGSVTLSPTISGAMGPTHSAVPQTLKAQIDPGGFLPVVTAAAPITAAVTFAANELGVNSITVPAGNRLNMPLPELTIRAEFNADIKLAGESYKLRFELRRFGNNSILLGEATFNATESGRFVVDYTFAVPASVTPDVYNVVLTVDPDNTNREPLENNNVGTFQLIINPPLTTDLVPAVVSVVPGQAPFITLTISNNGNTSQFNDTVTRFLLASSPNPTPAEIAAARELGRVATPGVNAGSSRTIERFVSFPDDLPLGTYYIVIQADGTGVVAESNEANNTVVTGPFTAGSLPPTIDLSPAITAYASVAGVVRVAGSITNSGNSVAAASTARIVLTTSSTPTAQQIAAGIQLGTFDVGALQAGGQFFFDQNIPLPANTPVASYFAIVIADSASAIAETSETNNTLASPFSITFGSPTPANQLPDLTAAIFTYTAGGGSVRLAGNIFNTGGSAAGATVSRALLVTTANPSAADLAAGIVLGQFSVPAVQVAVPFGFDQTFAIPAGTPIAGYFAVIIADSTGSLAETSEANNTAVSSTSVVTGTPAQGPTDPDLVPSVVSATGIIPAGNTLPVTFTVTNSGQSAAGASTAAIYLFSGSAFDLATAVLLGTTPVAGLAAGASTAVTFTATIPTTTLVGDYSVAVIADSASSVAEISEANNTATTSAASVTVQERPLGQVENDIGQPDRNFGNASGIVTTIIPGIPFVVVDTRVDSLGRQLAAGSADNGDIVILRLLASGQIDTTYAAGGVLRLATATPTIVSAIHLYADGSVLIAGYTNTAAANTPPVLGAILARITPGGQADATFGTGGILNITLPAAATTSKVASMVVAGDGSVYVGLDGSRLGVVKLAGDGSVIPAFAAAGLFSLTDADLTRAGVLTSRSASVAALAIDPASQDLLVAGNFSDEAGNDAGPLLARINSAGILNLKFAKGKLLAPAPTSGIARLDAIAIQAKGFILLAGSVRDGQVNATRADLYVVRTDAKGTQDRRFGTRGVFLQPAPAASPFLSASRVVPLADGRIVISAKVARSLANADLKVVGSAIVRLNAKGQADTGFGTGGFSLIFSPDTVITAAAVGDLQSEFTDFILSNQGLIALTPGGGILALASRATGENETTIAVTSVVSDGIDLIAIGTVKLTAPVNGAIVGGTRAQVSLTITNDGTLPASGTTTAALYLSTNSILGIDDARIASVPLKISNLKPGAKRKVSLRINLPTAGFDDGNYNLFARVNDAAALPEVNDVNNGVGLTPATSFAKPFIDLSLGFATLPANFTPGKRASIGVSVVNRGNTSANLRDLMNLFATLNADGAEPVEIALGSANVSGRLKPGQSRTVRANITPPATLLPGNTLTPRATLNVGADTDPANNTIFSSTPIAVV